MKKVLSFILWVIPICLMAAPYNGEIMSFKQPDGTWVDVKLYGTEYYMRAEGLDNYTVVRDKNTQWICYASLSADGAELISTGIKYRLTKNSVPTIKTAINAPKHIEISEKALEQQILKNKKALEGDDFQNHEMNPEPEIVTGAIKGLCIVVDFSDEPGTLPMDEFESFCNDMDYSNFGNNGSLRKYYYDISGGIVDYQNIVFGYFRAPKTFAEYDSMHIAYGAKAILDLALNWIESLGFDFSTLSINPDGSIKAINLMYTGVPKSWNEGMWWHQGTYTKFSADGVHSGKYNCSIAYNPLSLATVVHENGHMICHWDDTYKYYDQSGPDGIGAFDLMCNYSNAYNPVPPNPFYIIDAGWGNVVDITNYIGEISDIAEDLTYYEYRNVNDTNEFFIFDNRSKTGRSTYIPDEGLTIWHIDRLGDNQSFHHQVYLVHANNNMEAKEDICFHSGLNTEYNDNTEPNSQFYDRNPSRLIVHDISPVSYTMTYTLGPKEAIPVIRFSFLNISDDDNLNGLLEPGEFGNINMKVGNFGTANLGNATLACEAVDMNAGYVTINTAPKNLESILVQEDIAATFNIAVAGGIPIGKVITLKFTISSEADSSVFVKEFDIGNPVYMANQELSTCSSVFYDDGGRTHNYSCNTDLTTTFLAPSPGQFVKAEFLSFELESSNDCEYDYLSIYNGLSVSSPLIGTYCGNNSPATIESTDASGALTFQFHSDEALRGTGWEALITCTGISEVHNLSGDNAFEIYPNPSHDKVFVKITLNNSHNLRLVIVDTEGREILQYNISDQPLIEINRSTIPNGNYFIQLWKENDLKSVQKMVLL
jgi:M6 family metalloprotease-like protein